MCVCVEPMSVYCTQYIYVHIIFACTETILKSHWQTHTILMIPNHPMNINPWRLHPCQGFRFRKTQCPSLNTHNQGSVGTSEWKLGRTPQSEWLVFTEQNVGYWPNQTWTLNSWHLDIQQQKDEIQQLYLRYWPGKLTIWNPTEGCWLKFSALWEYWWSLSSLWWHKKWMTVAWRIDNG